jgi:hypothetical protein
MCVVDLKFITLKGAVASRNIFLYYLYVNPPQSVTQFTASVTAGLISHFVFGPTQKIKRRDIK